MRVSNVKETLRMMGSNVDPRLAAIIVSMAEEVAEHRQQIVSLIHVNQQVLELMKIFQTAFEQVTQKEGRGRLGQHTGQQVQEVGKVLNFVSNPKNADLVTSEPVSHETDKPEAS